MDVFLPQQMGPIRLLLILYVCPKMQFMYFFEAVVEQLVEIKVFCCLISLRSFPLVSEWLATFIKSTPISKRKLRLSMSKAEEKNVSQ